MVRRQIGPILVEMLEAIDGIESATAHKWLADFKQDWLLRMAVQRALEILSESSRHISNDLLLVAPDIRWKQIRGIGNILRHEYYKIADDVIWAVVTENLAALKAAVLRIRVEVQNR
jgi:uncharacterized protein with HEPN domain